MKATTQIGKATLTVGKLFFALILLLAAVAAGFGGTALIVYHGLGDGRTPAVRSTAERKAVSPAQNKVSTSKKDDATRPVAAQPADQPTYTYADNNGGQPSAPTRHARPGVNVPAPLENPAPVAEGPSSSIGLADPESHYIVDSRTGRVVGIDGSAGARREDEEEKRRLDAAPRAVAVQTPPPEVRVASAVVEDGQPVYRDGQSFNVATASGSQYLPVRRALSVTTGGDSAEPRNFNVAEYMAGSQSRPVLRAQPVGTRTTRVYRLSDGSQIVAAE